MIKLEKTQNKHGDLLVLKDKYCPFSRDEARCGEWCPFFNLNELYPTNDGILYSATLLCSHVEVMFKAKLEEQ